jgi:hypothetical protein
MPKPFILPKDIPMDQYPKPEVFLSEGRRIVDAAREAGLAMRVMGPLALHYYFPEQVDLYARLERLGERYFTDIDFVADGKSGGKMKGLMEKLGYECDVNTLMMTGKTRQIYYGGAVPMIDVFLDKLDYCHEVDFKNRLGFDDYCISLTDIALQKLQIWEINGKDLKDLEFLMTVADIGEDDAHKVNRAYVAKRLADDWGFWYTATTNLGRVKAHVDGVAAFDDSQKAHIKQRCDEVAARIEAEPKTKNWQKRAKKGTDKIWYNQNFSDW